MATGAVLLFFLAWNVPPLNFIPVILGLEPLMQINSYHYQTADGSYDDVEVSEKGRDLKVIERSFEAHKASRGMPELVLCRTFTRDWWRFWRWFEYVTNPRWAYPYRTRAVEVSK